PELSVNKEGSYDSVTGEVTYEITVTNVGNVDLEDITVEDDKLEYTETIDELIAGDSITLEQQTYTPTEQEIDAGEVVNLVTVTTPDPNNPDGDPIEAEDEEVTEVTEKDNPDLSFTKIANVQGGKTEAE